MEKLIKETVKATFEETIDGFVIRLEDGTLIKEQELEFEYSNWDEGSVSGSWQFYTWINDKSIEVVIYTRRGGQMLEYVERTLAA